MSNRISGPEALTLIRNGAVLIDVRSAAGRAANGEVKGAAIVAKSDVPDFLEHRTSLGATDRPVVLFCGSVAGSGPVIEQLLARGITNAVDVEGGFAALTGPDGLSLAG